MGGVVLEQILKKNNYKLTMKCKLCAFENPKATATAVIIRDGALLLVRRNEEPFKGMLDLPGGYLNKGETTEAALKRELFEELGIKPLAITPMGEFPGIAFWQEENFPILSSAYFVSFRGDIRLNRRENSSFVWVPLKELEPDKVAFDSNQHITAILKEKLCTDFGEATKLINQLDPSAQVSEDSFFRSQLNGYMSRKYLDDKLVGIGWIYPRRTALRSQAVIEDVVVDQAYRGQGHGEWITRDLLKWARDNGIQVVELTSGSHRVAANNLYKKVGFVLHPTNHYLLKNEDY